MMLDGRSRMTSNEILVDVTCLGDAAYLAANILKVSKSCFAESQIV
jgi:hypothetical protein